jgi:hypothetical protein
MLLFVPLLWLFGEMDDRLKGHLTEHNKPLIQTWSKTDANTDGPGETYGLRQSKTTEKLFKVREQSCETCAGFDTSETVSNQFDILRQNKTAQQIKQWTELGQWPSKASYTYNIATSQYHRDKLEMSITEHDTSGRVSNGGSHFWVFQEFYGVTLFRTMCGFHDYFNGTYTVCCTRAGNNCTNVTIIRSHKPFHGFIVAGEALDKVRRDERKQIWSDRLCWPSPFLDATHANSTPVAWELTTEKVEYQRNNLKRTDVPGTLGLCLNLHRNGVPVKVLNDTEACQCLAQYDTITMLGSSHFRYFKDYLLEVCNNTHPPVHINFEFTKFARSMHKYVHNYIKKLQSSKWTSSKPSAVWLQCGSWDLTFNTTYPALMAALPLYLEVLQTLNEALTNFPMIDLHVVAPPPNPHQHHVNNFVEAIYVNCLRHFSQRNSISFFDAFNLLLPCLNEHPQILTNKNHYFMHGGGRVGRVFWFGEFLGRLCI